MKIEELIQHKLRSIFKDESIVFDKSRFAGGLTNYNYIMDIQGREYVVRQPGGMTNEMIDRHVEKVNSEIVVPLGINTECVFLDEESGIKVSVYLKDSKNAALKDPNNPACLQAVSKLLKKTHKHEEKFPNIFDWKAELEKYEGIVRKLNGDFFFDYEEMKRDMLEFLENHLSDLVIVPCHNDTVPENFLFDKEDQAYLIDWEYSGMNDPSWDVAAYILESRLTGEAIDAFVLDYYERFPEPTEVMKIKCYILAQDLLWMAWALIRHYNGDDFLDYCNIRYERFRRNLREVLLNENFTLAEMVKA